MNDISGRENNQLSHDFIARSLIVIAVNLINMPNRRLRRRNAKAFQKLVRSIKHFGIVCPILVDKHYNIIDGHGIVEASMELGIDEVPAIVIDHLQDADIRALRIALNKIQELGEWNEEVLSEELQIITELDAEYDLELTGLELGEIEFHLSEKPDSSAEIEPDPVDQVPTETLGPDYKPIARLGDLFLLKGKQFEHRVYCGDARSKKALAMALGAWKAVMVLTDPPFDVPIQGHAGGLGKVKHREFIMASGELGPKKFYKLLFKALKRFWKALQDGGLAYIYMDRNGLELLLKAGRKLGFKLQNICIYKKSNAGMGSLYRSQHEYVVIFKKGKAPHVNNIALGKYGRYRTTVWEYPGFNSFSKERQELFKLHPTLKNNQMLSDAIRDVTKRGQVVLDSFAGAGSTLIAAEKTGRRSASIELDPIYVDTILRRFEKEFGIEAVHAGTGLSFSDLAEMRNSETQSSNELPLGATGKTMTGRIRTRKNFSPNQSKNGA